MFIKKDDDTKVSDKSEEIQQEGFVSDVSRFASQHPELAVTAVGFVLTAASKLYNVYQKSDLKQKVDHWAEDVYNGIWARVRVNESDKTVSIKGINYDKLLIRLKEMFKEKRVADNFEFQYSLYSTLLFNLRLEDRKDMTKTQITMPLFFALELQMLFDILGEHYDMDYYRYLQKALVNKTWVKTMMERGGGRKIDLSRVKPVMKYTLKEYQSEFVENYDILKQSSGLEGYILSFEQGLGKTLTSVALAEALGKDQVVIVCPNTIRENWAMEIKEYFNKYEDDDTFYDEVYVTNNKKYAVTAKTKYFIVNHEQIPLLFPYLKSSKDTMIIVDEMHFFRNMNGSRVGELLKLKQVTKCKDTLLMSGTPIKALATEIIPALMMIDPMFSKEAAVIYNRLFNIDTDALQKIVNRRFGLIIYRKRREEVLSLPPKYELQLQLTLPNYEDYLIDNVSARIGEEYDRIYLELKMSVSELQAKYLQYVDHFQSANILDKNTYRSFITNEVSKEKRKVRHELSDKFFDEYNEKYVLPNIKSADLKKEFIDLSKKFMDMRKSAMAKAIGKVLPPARSQMYQEMFVQNKDTIVKMINENTKKTIIFTTILDVADVIYKTLSAEGIGVLKVIGETGNRQEIFDSFRSDDRYDVLVATSQTLSTGVTLNVANQVMFFAVPWRAADYEQAYSRCYRIGQTSPVYIHIAMLNQVQPNLSTRMMDILQWSGDLSSSYIDGKDKPLI